MINYQFDKVTALFKPTQYPIKSSETYKDMSVPEDIRRDFNQLTAFIEDKYTKEFLKVCAFYNKMFVSLKQYDWSRSSYNALPFTVQDQERMDTGTGLTSNYMKAAVDMIVSRLGNTKFEYKVVTESPTVQFEVYKDVVNQELRELVRKNKLSRLAVESFHDAAILNFSHAFIDPWSNRIRKIPDWELGFYESEFGEGRLKRVVIRDFAFPISELDPYLGGFNAEDIADWKRRSSSVDLRLYIDCFKKKKYVAVGSKMAEPTDYDFDELLLSTFSWDIGVRKTTVTSLFDTLYPLQRQVNKLLAKETQLLAMYKGKVPVFSGGKDVDLIVKSISNGAGECLFLDSGRDPSTMIAMMDFAPMDPELVARIESLRATIFELANVQQISMDIENYRSAAAAIALDQKQDAGFQTQLGNVADFLSDLLQKSIVYMASTNDDWSMIKELVETATIAIKPIQNLEQEPIDGEPIDYMLRHVEALITRVCQGKATFDNIDYTYDYSLVKQRAAMRMLEYRVLNDAGRDEVSSLQAFLIDCFVEDIRLGQVDLVFDTNIPAELPPPEEGI